MPFIAYPLLTLLMSISGGIAISSMKDDWFWVALLSVAGVVTLKLIDDCFAGAVLQARIDQARQMAAICKEQGRAQQ